MTELDEALVASMKLVNNKTLMGAYATTREWEDEMYGCVNDLFVDDGMDNGDALVDDEDRGFGLISSYWSTAAEESSS